MMPPAPTALKDSTLEGTLMSGSKVFSEFFGFHITVILDWHGSGRKNDARLPIEKPMKTMDVSAVVWAFACTTCKNCAIGS
jgi:hypothetical protein